MADFKAVLAAGKNICRKDEKQNGIQTYYLLITTRKSLGGTSLLMAMFLAMKYAEFLKRFLILWFIVFQLLQLNCYT